MQTTILRKVGDSVMMTVPPAILEELSLAAGATVSMHVEAGRLIVPATQAQVHARGTAGRL